MMIESTGSNGKRSMAVIAQALIVAAITAAVTGYVSAKVLETQVNHLIQEIIRVDAHSRDTRAKLDEVSMRQAGVIMQANTIHEGQNRRIERLENRK